MKRSFSQPDDFITVYSDFVQVLRTGDEVVLTVYETVPGVPDDAGQVTSANSRLRACVTMSPAHALRVSALLAGAGAATTGDPNDV